MAFPRTGSRAKNTAALRIDSFLDTPSIESPREIREFSRTLEHSGQQHHQIHVSKPPLSYMGRNPSYNETSDHGNKDEDFFGSVSRSPRRAKTTHFDDKRLDECLNPYIIVTKSCDANADGPQSRNRYILDHQGSIRSRASFQSDESRNLEARGNSSPTYREPQSAKTCKEFAQFERKKSEKQDVDIKAVYFSVLSVVSANSRTSSDNSTPDVNSMNTRRPKTLQDIGMNKATFSPSRRCVRDEDAGSSLRSLHNLTVCRSTSDDDFYLGSNISNSDQAGKIPSQHENEHHRVGPVVISTENNFRTVQLFKDNVKDFFAGPYRAKSVKTLSPIQEEDENDVNDDDE